MALPADTQVRPQSRQRAGVGDAVRLTRLSRIRAPAQVHTTSRRGPFICLGRRSPNRPALNTVLVELLRHEAPVFGQQPVLLLRALVFCLLGLPLALRRSSSIILAQVPHEEPTSASPVMFPTHDAGRSRHRAGALYRTTRGWRCSNAGQRVQGDWGNPAVKPRFFWARQSPLFTAS